MRGMGRGWGRSRSRVSEMVVGVWGVSWFGVCVGVWWRGRWGLGGLVYMDEYKGERAATPTRRAG
jgi:hypothetical protein